ncbi:hypothetical protein T02_2817 [Trichinella nativa]|uniref:Uncharacterized protein n=2 Tax=Trichinella TaxID=6333 RepID=A0A0V1L8F1_9BILA|nr:hypothetical protein T12_15858 [Trichinella patagoniensis]KRZ55580.1 hypothetical protein T02_2817 [Trichinella nativa]
MSSVDCMPAVVGYPMVAWYPQTMSSHSFDPFPERLVPLDIIFAEGNKSTMPATMLVPWSNSLFACLFVGIFLKQTNSVRAENRAGDHFDTFQPFHNYYTSKSQGGHIAL